MVAQTMSANIEDLLNTQQRAVLEAWRNTTDNIFCTGHGGTGKSWLLECIVSDIRPQSSPRTAQSGSSPVVAVTAPTGTAAFNVRGITIHRFAGIGVETENIGNMIRLASKPSSKRLWQDVDILVIDEISMISGVFFENLNIVARTIRDSLEPFGGIRLLVFGDFLQLPPPTSFNMRAFRAFECQAWRDCNMSTFLLTETVRQSNEEFVRILNCIRLGLCNDEIITYIRHLSRAIDYDDDIEPVKLFAKRKPVEAYNTEKLRLIEEDLHTFIADDTGSTVSLNTCPAPSTLELKKGARVMLTRNLSKDLVNGSIGIVKGFTEVDHIEMPVIDIVGESGSVKELVVSRVSWESIAPNGAVIARRIQIPLILSWAMTIHRSQSKTIPRVFINMSGIFESGQAYVALSRCKSPENLQVINFTPECIKADVPSVEFYNNLDTINSIDPGELPPSYDSSHADISIVPNYDSTATEVAPATRTSWEQNTADTQRMLGHLSIGSTQEM